MRSAVFILRCSVAAIPLAVCASCTDLQLRSHRDPELLRTHRYALGESHVEVNGLRVCYQERGQGETVLIIPGLGTSIDFWQLAIPALAERYHVVAVDPPGFGKSDKPDVGYDLEWIVEQVVAFMDRMEIERATLMGGSLGGHLAVLIALNHPQRVQKLVLMGSCGAWSRTGPIAELGLLVLWHDPIVIDHMRRTWPETYWKIVGKRTPVSESLFRYQMALRASPSAYWQEGRAAARALKSIFHTYTRPQIPGVRSETLLVWGDDDRIHLLEEGLYFRDHLPNARMVVVRDSAHEVMLDQPEVFNRLVLQFLDGGLRAVNDDYAWAAHR